MPEFYLSALDGSFNSIKANMESKNYPTITDFSASININIAKADIRKLFQYDSSNVITHINDTAADDLRFYVDATKWPASNNGEVISDVTLNENVNLILKSDYISHLAKQLFNTERGVDLFSNETALVTDFKSKCHTFWDDLSQNYITKVDKANGTHGSLTGPSGNKYLTNTTNTNVNLSRELLLQIIDVSSNRFSNIQTDYDNNATGLYPVPFEVNDKVSFILTVKSDPQQKSVIASTGSISDRKYKLSLTVT